MSAVAASFVQDVDARAIGTHHLAILNIQEYAGMTEGTTIAGDRAVVDVIGFQGKSSAVRHFGPRSGGLRDVMIAMPRMRSTMLSVALMAILTLSGCVGDVVSPGVSLLGTARSSIGHSGLPVTRSNTHTKPCLLTWATASIDLPS